MMGESTTQNMYSSFQKQINSVTFHLVGYILEYTYDARTHERYTHFVFNNFVSEIVPLVVLKNMVEPDRQQMTIQYGACALRAG
jgi:hypothetical protein